MTRQGAALPLPHRAARLLATRGLVGSSLYWAAARRLRPGHPQGPVLLDGCPLDADFDTDWIARSIYEGTYERAELRLLEALLQPGDRVVDVGANIGYVSLRIARRIGPSGQVLAFEPSATCRSLAARNLDAAGALNVTLRPQALGAQSGLGRLRHPDSTHSGSATLRQGAGGSGESVEITCLDDALAGEGWTAVDLVKVDVEGWEHEVLAGAADLFARRAMKALLLEASPEFGGAEPLADVLQRHARGYRIFKVGEHGAPLRRARLEPLDIDQMRHLVRQANVLVIRDDHVASLERFRS